MRQKIYMPVVIFFIAITNFKSDLSPLKSPDTHNILFINSEMDEQLQESHRNLFEKIHVIDPITFDTTLPWVIHYLENGAASPIPTKLS